MTAPTAHSPGFVDLFWRAKNRANFCTVTLLAWIAACDGQVPPSEEAFLRRVLAGGGGDADLSLVLQIAKAARADDLELACRYVSTRFSRRQKRRLAQLAVMLTVQDGHITVGENYALQFLADLLGIRPRAFAKLFQEITHRPYPEAGDPSSIEWWQLRESGVQAAAYDVGPEEPAAAASATSGPTVNDAAPPPAEPAAGPITRSRALMMFGLFDGASPDAVRSAFRRLAKVRHPDRFAKLGPSAIAAATESFQKLEEAYAMLKA